MNSFARLLAVIGVALVLSGCQSVPQANSPKAATAQDTSSSRTQTYDIPAGLVSLNKLFLQSYQDRRLFVKTNSNPVIVGAFDKLILHWNGVTETNQAIPNIYHALKAVAHMPFGIFLRLDGVASDAGTGIPEPLLSELKKYRQQLNESESALDLAGFSALQKTRQRAIFGGAKEYLDGVIQGSIATRKDLNVFAKHLGPLMMANVNDAAVAQIEMTHDVVMRWKKRIPAEEWKRLTVVIPGLQTPRRYNIFTIYFARIVNEPGHNLGYPLESKRLIYAEFILPGRDYLDLMATTFVDGDASEAFFGDRWRMSRDVLADGAQEYVQRLKFD